MNLSKLTNNELLNRTQLLVVEERRITLEVLHHLREIDNRKLHLEQGCASLFDYCVRVLQYSESAAHRRISSMRLLRELPTIEKKIEEGKVTLTNVSQLQTFLKAEKKINKTYSERQKLELVSAIEGKSSRACEALLMSLAPQSVPKEKTRTITEEITELRLAIPKELLQKLERLKSLNSHRLKDLSWLSVLELIVDEHLKRTDPENSKPRPAPVLLCDKRRPDREVAKTVSKAQSRCIPSALKREVWKRDQGQCVYRDP